jgi:hypothetical protein
MDKFKIHYAKMNSLSLQPLEESYAPSEEERKYEYNPFRISNLQNYNPIYSEFFVMNDKNYDRIAFNHKYHIKDLTTVVDSETTDALKAPIFIKYSPLLDPLRFMIGKYDLSDNKTRTLPALDNTTIPKLASYHNSSYVDNFFCYLNSQLLNRHSIVNCLDYYGSFLGIQEKYKMNIADDLEYVSSSSFFKDNVGKHFEVHHDNPHEYVNFGSRANKLKLNISTELQELDVVAIDDIIETEDAPQELGELVYENSKKKTDEEKANDDSSSDSSNNSELNYSSEEDSEDADEDEDEDDDNDDDEEWETESESAYESLDDDEYISAYINNFPVQMICLEKCDGTLDELFMKNQVNNETGAAVLMQIIMTLLLLQKTFRFTHNDLHTNNIMYVKTELPFLYYKFENIVYKVPTYGKIFKIIDFGRAIYRFQGKIFCSDSFAPGGDAATQYNCEPFLNENKPRLEPNYSFDLSRLGTSIYDFVIGESEEENMDEFQKTIHRWCLDDNKKNVLYKKNGDDRYPNFKLYKMISRTVHQHTPENQLKFSYFKQFQLKSKGAINGSIVDIDALPCYA